MRLFIAQRLTTHLALSVLATTYRCVPLVGVNNVPVLAVNLSSVYSVSLCCQCASNACCRQEEDTQGWPSTFHKRG